MYNFVTLMAAAVLATAVQTAEIASMGELDQDYVPETNDKMDVVDATSAPLCGQPVIIGRPFDRYPPQDNCCRIYELKNMYGKYL